MKQAIKPLNLLDRNDFLNVYFVTKLTKNNEFTIESIAFLTFDEAQNQCNYKNSLCKKKIYSVYSTCAHIS